MNEITEKLFSLIAENTEESLQQIKVLITTSITLKSSNLSKLAIDFNAEQAPIFELTEKLAKNIKKGPLPISKRKNQSEPFRLTSLAFAIYYNNLPAFKLLLEQGLSINAGHPSPLWCAVYRKADITTIEMLIVKGANFNYEYLSNLNLDNFLIEHSEERKNNYLYSSSTYKATSPLFMAVISENVSLAKLLLLHGAMPTASVKQSLVDQSNKLTKPYKERYLENDIGYKYVQEQQERLVATVTLPLNKLFTCIEEIELAKQAFNAKQSSKLTKHVASACEYDMMFFLDYLHMTVKKINLFQYYDNQPPSYIPACLSVFVFITKLSNFPDPAMFNYFQQKLLLEIEGHDADSNPHKLFTNNQEKHAWFELMSTDTNWQKTLHVMNATPNNKASVNVTTLSNAPFFKTVNKADTSKTDIATINHWRKDQKPK